ncbi:hypothetical protein CDAR_200701 [Caerostris darwini]|uniref:Uncharacterized protein n=1 Tax=Caerostris darwini TaxID=1538125 RepID=A0AAV4TZZ1_9ARAC|nr:hypothetical protein CDAR_200701 [Caerostris darwini]
MSHRFVRRNLRRQASAISLDSSSKVSSPSASPRRLSRNTPQYHRRTVRIPGHQHPRDRSVILSWRSGRSGINSPRRRAVWRAWLRRPTPAGDQYGLHHSRQNGRGNAGSASRMRSSLPNRE